MAPQCPESLAFPDIAMAIFTRSFSFAKIVPPGNGLTNLEAMRALDGLRAKLEQPCPVAHIGSHPEDERLKILESYLPLLQTLINKEGVMFTNANDLKLEWTTMAYPKKFFKLSNLEQEYGIVTMLYGATLCAQAQWTLRHGAAADQKDAAGMSQETAQQAATLLRRGAGVFEFAQASLTEGLRSLPATRPDEMVPSMAEAMKNVALAQAQAVVARRAYERSGGTTLVAALYKGVIHFTELV